MIGLNLNFFNEIPKIFIGVFLNNIILIGINNIVNFITKKGYLDDNLRKRNNIDFYYLCNSMILSTYSLYSLYNNDYNLMVYIKYYNIGYLLNDIYRMNIIPYYKKNNIIFTLHHLIFIFGWYYSHLYNRIFSQLLLAELNVVTFNLRFILYNNKIKYYEIFGILTYILFFIFRVCNFTYILYIKYDIIMKYLYILYIPLLLLQYYWFILLTRKMIEIVRKYFNNKK